MRWTQKTALAAATLVAALVAAGAGVAHPGAIACRYSYSEHASGTCSHHGGVARWIRHP